MDRLVDIKQENVGRFGEPFRGQIDQASTVYEEK